MANSLSLLKRRMLENQGERWQLRALDHKGLGYTSTATCDGPAAAQPWRGRSPRRHGSTCTLSTILAERGSSSHHVEAHPDPPGLPTLTMSVSLLTHQRTGRFLGPQAAQLLGSGRSQGIFRGSCWSGSETGIFLGFLLSTHLFHYLSSQCMKLIQGHIVHRLTSGRVAENK